MQRPEDTETHDAPVFAEVFPVDVPQESFGDGLKRKKKKFDELKIEIK